MGYKKNYTETRAQKNVLIGLLYCLRAKRRITSGISKKRKARADVWGSEGDGIQM